ncbi:dTDP-4-amino-4,6-dideoxygalactose transaminase [Acinetobacter wuhouensis]|uniref:dTDP-4-amino-4,6-dideoxygalactose transaminase n=1 Tax=Acinetobacter wuhouensis TaxID=1879050 RepID=UPI001023E4D4|nr:dTDP-4-amino-4,6-dideoxygalactose transaminase [Acinetobacter wuhouensis]RZG75960.1 dTDP-4-amino-4,6-dideoxygalactose transaminase [Acinetobacter wuhouensis]
MIPFNKSPYTGDEDKYVLDVMHNQKMSGDSIYTERCHKWFEVNLPCPKALLTPSCTHALELAAILINIGVGDEVIMPSYTFVSTANAFVLRGAKIVFVDIRPDTMNIDENKIEEAITKNTKAIVPVHYAGVSCEMDTIMSIAHKYNLYVIEDAAQGMHSTYKGKALGTIGHLGAYSFHDTKNYTSGGEGGLLIVNDEQFKERAEIVREKGTNRGQFFRGMIDKYSWVDIGSSYLASDLQAAYLWGQLGRIEDINNYRLDIWQEYYNHLKPLVLNGKIELPIVPIGCLHNAHMFYIKLKNLTERSRLIEFLKNSNISSAFHYVPLHNSVIGQEYGYFSGEDIYTTKESERLVRLPIWYGIDKKDILLIAKKVEEFFS